MSAPWGQPLTHNEDLLWWYPLPANFIIRSHGNTAWLNTSHQRPPFCQWIFDANGVCYVHVHSAMPITGVIVPKIVVKRVNQPWLGTVREFVISIAVFLPNNPVHCHTMMMITIIIIIIIIIILLLLLLIIIIIRRRRRRIVMVFVAYMYIPSCPLREFVPKIVKPVN